MFFKTYRLAIAALSLLVLISCAKEDPSVQPVIELVPGPGYIAENATVIPGTLMSFQVSMSVGSEMITNFFIEVNSAEEGTKRLFDTAMYARQLTWTGSFHKSAEPSETWTFVVRDRQGGSSLAELTLLADTGSVYGPVIHLDHILLGAQNNNQSGSFYSFADQAVYFIQEAENRQGVIDVVAYFGEDALTIASPGANIEDEIFPDLVSPVNWEVRNTTRYIKTSLTNADFDGVMSDSLMIALYVDTEGKRKAKNLSADDIYVFKNQENRLGLFRVNSASGTMEGLIDVDVKIQPVDK
jgi:hypothetical protein